jgi:hypothetical protein
MKGLWMWKKLTLLLVIGITVGCDTGASGVSEVASVEEGLEVQATAVIGPVDDAPGVVDGMMGGLRFADVFLNAFVGDQQRRPLNALVATSLPAAASNTWVKQALNYPRARRVLQYISECALPPGSRVRFWSADGNWQGWFDGVGGVAPEWQSGWCNERCQQTVSACLYSRINGDDRVININVRRNLASGGHVVDQFWKDNYPRLEAAYWGNFFRGFDDYGLLDMHACFGFDATAGDWRVAQFRKRYCGENDSSQACASVIAGPCGMTRSCPLAANDPFKKQCKGNPWDANGAAGACSPVPWENACTSGHANPETYPTPIAARTPTSRKARRWSASAPPACRWWPRARTACIARPSSGTRSA